MYKGFQILHVELRKNKSTYMAKKAEKAETEAELFSPRETLAAAELASMGNATSRNLIDIAGRRHAAKDPGKRI